jgi:hypothetical protein
MNNKLLAILDIAKQIGIQSRGDVLHSEFTDGITVADLCKLVETYSTLINETETMFLYRRKGIEDYVTCDYERYAELSNNHLFEVRKVSIQG